MFIYINGKCDKIIIFDRLLVIMRWWYLLIYKEFIVQYYYLKNSISYLWPSLISSS